MAFSSNLQYAKLQNFLSIRLNHSGLSCDMKKSKFLPYNFSRYNFEKLFQTLNYGNIEEWCNSTGEIRTWGTSVQFVLTKQKGWRSSTCNKSQISAEQCHTLTVFQNGRDAFNEGSSLRT